MHSEMNFFHHMIVHDQVHSFWEPNKAKPTRFSVVFLDATTHLYKRVCPIQKNRNSDASYCPPGLDNKMVVITLSSPHLLQFLMINPSYPGRNPTNPNLETAAFWLTTRERMESHQARNATSSASETGDVSPLSLRMSDYICTWGVVFVVQHFLWFRFCRSPFEVFTRRETHQLAEEEK